MPVGRAPTCVRAEKPSEGVVGVVDPFARDGGV